MIVADAVVGLLFSYVVRWGGSILGVTLMHGLTNSTLFILMPYLWANPQSDLASVAPWAIGAGTLLSVVAVIAIWKRSCPAKVSAPSLVAAHVTEQTTRLLTATPWKQPVVSRRSKSFILATATVYGGVLPGAPLTDRIKMWVER